MKKKLFIGSTLILLLLLTGCQQKLSLNFYPNEKWKLKAEVDLNAGVLQDLGSAAGSFLSDAFNFNISGESFNPEKYLRPVMSLMAKFLRSYGVDFNWKYDRKLLKYDMAGDSLKLFKESQLITDLGDGTYRLDVDLKEMIYEVENKLGSEFGYEFGTEFDSVLDLAGNLFVENIVEISVGKIYETNADKIVGSKAIWYNPEHIYIVYRPGYGTGILKLLLWVIGIVLALIVLIVIFKGLRRKTCPSCGSRVKLSAVACPNCGTNFGD